MAKIVWSPSSLNDLLEIHQYISRDSEYQANKFVNKIIEYSEQVSSFPKIGKIMKELFIDGYREILCDPYRIIYRIVSDEEIRILSVVHGARDWKPDIES